MARSRTEPLRRKHGWRTPCLLLGSALCLAALLFTAPRLRAQQAPTPTVVSAPSAAPAADELPITAGEAIQLPFGEQAWLPLFLVMGCSLLALAFGAYWWHTTMRHDPGSARMRSVAAAIQEGAVTYLRWQLRTMTPLILALAAGLFVLSKSQYGFLDTGRHSAPLGLSMSLWIALGVSLAFVLGVASSYVAGFVGMSVAVRGNVRVAHAALSSFRRALHVAFRAGAVSGMFVTGLGLLGATLIIMLFRDKAMFVLLGFGFGSSLAALFMRVGGGIFTKAADVGADLVGKVEAGIPEDDPRNAATIADNVGDNVGDCAGMAADVFESYEATLVAAILLAAAVGLSLTHAGLGSLLDPGAFTFTFTLNLVLYALLARAVGVIASIVGVFAVNARDEGDIDPMKPINIGFNVSALIAALGFLGVAWLLFREVDFAAVVAAAGSTTPAGQTLATIGDNFWWLIFLATLVGIVLSQVIGKLTEYFTADTSKPVTEIAASAKTGPATLLLAGLSEGMESSVWAIVAIAATIYGAFMLFPDPALAAYAIALAGLGMLATTGFVLTMDTYGPIVDNANGIFEMSCALKNEDGTQNTCANIIVARLDMVGNTTKALTKGFAIGSAVIAAVALYRSYMDVVGAAQLQAGIVDTYTGVAEIMARNIPVNLPQVFIGLLLGGAVPFLFSSLAIRAVSRAAVLLVEEVRRQFREIPGIWEYTGVGDVGKPDYSKCVAISTAAAQRELLGPGVLAVFSPILVGFWLGPYALGGFLAGTIVVGQLMAVFMCNAGGAWDNAKKKIEDGFLGGKGSDAHKAAVIGDTVGDPLKDTAGPSLNMIIKVMNLVAILIAPATVHLRTVQNTSTLASWGVTLAALLILTIAIAYSKRGGVIATSEEELHVPTRG